MSTIEKGRNKAFGLNLIIYRKDVERMNLTIIRLQKYRNNGNWAKSYFDVLE